ncbi:hypothetical protein JOM56_000286 [Amanita muscaria]
MQDYCLYLNRAELVFYPFGVAFDMGLQPTVVQPVPPRNRKQPSALELSTFFLAQHEITAVENVMYAHIHTPLPEQVQLVGENYVLNGTRKAWKYGQRLGLMYGDQRIEPCCDKWIFQFKVAVPDTQA